MRVGAQRSTISGGIGCIGWPSARSIGVRPRGGSIGASSVAAAGTGSREGVEQRVEHQRSPAGSNRRRRCDRRATAKHCRTRCFNQEKRASRPRSAGCDRMPHERWRPAGRVRGDDGRGRVRSGDYRRRDDRPGAGLRHRRRGTAGHVVERQALGATIAPPFDGRVPRSRRARGACSGDRALAGACRRGRADPRHPRRRAPLAADRALRPSGGRRQAAWPHRREPGDPARVAAPAEQLPATTLILAAPDQVRVSSAARQGLWRGSQAAGGARRWSPPPRAAPRRPAPPAASSPALGLRSDRHRRHGRARAAAPGPRGRALLPRRPVRDAADDRPALIDRLGGRTPARARADRPRRRRIRGRVGERFGERLGP